MDIKILLSAIPYELERSLFSHINRLLKRRPSSAPFLSGDTYRSFANCVYDETKKCTANEIDEKSIVFVSSWLLKEFANKILPNIKSNFILISHQGDVNITEEYAHIAENSHVIHWFAQNCMLEHKKITPLPIGLEDAWRHNAGCLSDYKKLYAKTKRMQKSANAFYNKIAKTVVAFTIGTNPDSRFACYKAYWKKPQTAEFLQNLTCRQYRNLLQKHLFVASPAGNGLDCHRTWEALYLGVIPLVENNYMHQHFVSLGLPIILVDDWNIPANWTENEARQIYHNTMQKANLNAAFFDFWKEKIKGVKK